MKFEGLRLDRRLHRLPNLSPIYGPGGKQMCLRKCTVEEAAENVKRRVGVDKNLSFRIATGFARRGTHGSHEVPYVEAGSEDEDDEVHAKDMHADDDHMLSDDRDPLPSLEASERSHCTSGHAGGETDGMGAAGEDGRVSSPTTDSAWTSGVPQGSFGPPLATDPTEPSTFIEARPSASTKARPFASTEASPSVPPNSKADRR